MTLHNEDIEKARALPIGTQRHGRIKISANPSIWKPISSFYKLKERNELAKIAEKYNIDSLPVISQKGFYKQVDLLYAGGIENDRKIKNVIRLPDFNIYLARRLGVTSKCYFTKTQMTHCRPSRKAKYNQALRIEEFKRIPKVIRNSKILYYDKMNENFFIPFRDRENPNKINKISFYKDINGNYAVSVGKVELSTLKRKEFIKLGVGNKPQIHKSRRKVGVAPTIQRYPYLHKDNAPITRFSESSAYDLNKDRQLELHQQYQSVNVKKLNSPPITRFSALPVSYDEIILQSDIKSIYKAIVEKLKNIERLINSINKSLQRREALCQKILKISEEIG